LRCHFSVLLIVLPVNVDTLKRSNVTSIIGVYQSGVGFYRMIDNASSWSPSTDRYPAWDTIAADRPIAGDFFVPALRVQKIFNGIF
jgi:hypothetical protein